MGTYGCAGYCNKPKTDGKTIDIEGPSRVSISNGNYKDSEKNPEKGTSKKVIEIDNSYTSRKSNDTAIKTSKKSKTLLPAVNSSSYSGETGMSPPRKKKRSNTIYNLKVSYSEDQNINPVDVFHEKLEKDKIEAQKARSKDKKDKKFSTTINNKPFFPKKQMHEEMERLFNSKLSEKQDFEIILNEIEQDKGIVFKNSKSKAKKQSKNNLNNVDEVKQKIISN